MHIRFLPSVKKGTPFVFQARGHLFYGIVSGLTLYHIFAAHRQKELSEERTPCLCFCADRGQGNGREPICRNGFSSAAWLGQRGHFSRSVLSGQGRVRCVLLATSSI